jgi:hypothetical protein
VVSDASPGTIIPLETATAPLRLPRQKPRSEAFAILGNGDMHNPQPLVLPHPSAKKDLLTGEPLPAVLRPAQVVVYAV